MLSIGLTGGIGTGKSAAAAMLGELGAAVVDADKVGHEIYRPGRPAWSRLVDTFGRDIVAPDGTIDRRRLGVLVFSDPDALARLNAIVHPLMADEISARIDALRCQPVPPPAAVIEAAVLVEARWDALVDEVWLVTAEREQAIARVVAARGLARAEVERRIDHQLSDVERRRVATLVIDNSGTPAELRRAIERLWRERVTDAAAGARG